jgi:hypothetical protein
MFDIYPNYIRDFSHVEFSCFTNDRHFSVKNYNSEISSSAFISKGVSDIKEKYSIFPFFFVLMIIIIDMFVILIVTCL